MSEMNELSSEFRSRYPTIGVLRISKWMDLADHPGTAGRISSIWPVDSLS